MCAMNFSECLQGLSSHRCLLLHICGVFYVEIQVNISISNMGNLEYPAYVEVDRRSRSYFLYQ